MIDQGTVALVTGANRGIGRALVQALSATHVTKIYAGVRSLAAFEPIVLATNVVPIEIDVTRPEQIERLAVTAPDVTLLFNNAGVLSFGDIISASWDDIEHNLAVNYLGKLRLARAFAPVIERNGGGAIVNTLTLVALASMPELSIYNASKAAAWSMTQSLRASLLNRNVRVHGVFPGAVDTDMLKDVDIEKASPSDVALAILKGVTDDEEDIFPDAMSRSLYSAWKEDHKAVEKQFANM